MTGVRIATALVFLLLPLGARAEILGAELRVNGMACPFCAFGIEKKLRAVAGVHDLDVQLDAGLIVVQLQPANRTTTRALAEAVRRAGFELAHLRIEVRGAIERDASGVYLDASPGPRLRLLEEVDASRRPAGEGTFQRLRAAAGSGAIRIEGSVEEAHAEFAELVVERYRAAE